MLIAVVCGAWLGGAASVTIAAAGDSTSAPDAPVDPDAASTYPCGNWPMYGATLARTFSNDCPSGLSTLSAPTLAPAWVVKTPRTVTASPVVVDGSLYVGDWSGTFYALDAATGSERWRYTIDPAPNVPFGPIVSSAAVADVVVAGRMRRLVVFGGGPTLFALDTSDGSLVWRLDLLQGPPGERNETEIESSPLVWGGSVYVGLDTHGQAEVDTGGVRGGLLVVDVATGVERWRFEPELEQPGVGCGGVWSSPLLDAARGNVVFGTANCSAPAEGFTWNRHTEAITALDARTGEVVWTFSPHPPNRLDIDFGATPNLFVDSAGREVLGAGNKDAVYYALDPATGVERWHTQVAEPGNVQEDFAIGGFIGSPAAYEGRVFGGTALGGAPYFHALDGATGASLWTGSQAPSYAATAVGGGVVMSGALDGIFRAYDAVTGAPLLSQPLLGPVSSGPAIVGDWVFIGSGTSSSDLCAKDAPGADQCFAFFDTTLGSTGGIHGFRLAASTAPPSAAGGTPLRTVASTAAPLPVGGNDLPGDAPDTAAATSGSALPATGGDLGGWVLGAVLAVAALATRRAASTLR